MYYTALYSRSGALLFDGHFQDMRACLQQAWQQNICLDGLHAENMDLRDVTFDGLSLKGANFRGADLSGANLAEAELGQADFTGSILINTCFAEADLHLAKFHEANLAATIWDGAIIDRAYFDVGNIRHVDFSALSSHRQVRVLSADKRIIETDNMPYLISMQGQSVLIINQKIVPINATYDSKILCDVARLLIESLDVSGVMAEGVVFPEYQSINATINTIS